MTDDQFSKLMNEILSLRQQVEELRLQIARNQNLADVRHKVIADWIGPDMDRASMPTDIPADVRKLLGL